MGGGAKYDFTARTAKAASLGYDKVHEDTGRVFEQQKKGEAHESMRSQTAKFRESRDSETNPIAIPIILGLDVTGSMGQLPKFLVTEGLPKIMTKLVQRGLDPALLFTAIGDHESDKYPMQIGQFESNDDPLDLWLTRTYLEGGGGSNAGESYLLSWYFAAKQTATDHWDKRGKKGFLFTIGDEPNLQNLPAAAIAEVFDNHQEKSYTAAELLTLVQEKWDVYHIHVNHGYGSRAGTAVTQWKATLGQNFIQIDSVNQVADTIIKTIVDHLDSEPITTPMTTDVAPSKPTGDHTPTTML